MITFRFYDLCTVRIAHKDRGRLQVLLRPCYLFPYQPSLPAYNDMFLSPRDKGFKSIQIIIEGEKNR